VICGAFTGQWMLKKVLIDAAVANVFARVHH
jgi:hypothetical protein